MPDKLIFSEKGRLSILDHAMGAVKLGSTLIGISNNECLVLIRAKFYDDIREQIFDNGSIGNFDKNIGYGLSGFTADGRIIIDKIRRFVQNQNFIFNTSPSVDLCAKTLRNFSSFVNNCEENEVFITRPPGVAFLLCGYDKSGGHLLQIDPLGRCLKKNTASIGVVRKYANKAMHEGYRKRMNCKETIILGIRSISTTDPGSPLGENYEIGFSDKTNKEFKKLTELEIKKIIKDV